MNKLLKIKLTWCFKGSTVKNSISKMPKNKLVGTCHGASELRLISRANEAEGRTGSCGWPDPTHTLRTYAQTGHTNTSIFKMLNNLNKRKHKPSPSTTDKRQKAHCTFSQLRNALKQFSTSPRARCRATSCMASLTADWERNTSRHMLAMNRVNFSDSGKSVRKRGVKRAFMSHLGNCFNN